MTVTNSDFSKSDDLFKIAYGMAFGEDAKPTKRQASKWRHGRGKAFGYIKEARQVLRERFEPKKTTEAA